MEQQQIGIFGGTFNPVHNGHVLLAQHYINALGLHNLLVIPAKTPPHKLAPELAGEQLRLQMCRLAFADIPQVQVSDMELRRPGKSFTVDTVLALRQLYPKAQFYLLVGSDMFLSFDRWRQWQEILSQVTLCTAARTQGDLVRLRDYANFLNQYGRTMVYDFPVAEISSTAIRTALKEGKDCSGLLPEKVYRFILQKNLYRGQDEDESRK